MSDQSTETQVLDSASIADNATQLVTVKRLSKIQRISDGVIPRTLNIHTGPTQNYIVKAFERTQKALAEIFRNSRIVSSVAIPTKDGTKITRDAGEFRGEVREKILALKVYMDKKMEEADLLTQDCPDKESVQFTGVKSVYFSITTPESNLYTYFIEVMDYVIMQYEIAWLNMLIDDNEKNKLTSLLIREISQTSFYIAESSYAFLNARRSILKRRAAKRAEKVNSSQKPASKTQKSDDETDAK